MINQLCGRFFVYRIAQNKIGMKKRNTKKGEFVCRRQKPSDKSFSLKESYRLAYFEVMNRPAYIIRKRKINNVIYVGRDKREADRLLKFFNK